MSQSHSEFRKISRRDSDIWIMFVSVMEYSEINKSRIALPPSVYGLKGHRNSFLKERVECVLSGTPIDGCE